jgi:hypothetical protein
MIWKIGDVSLSCSGGWSRRYCMRYDVMRTKKNHAPAHKVADDKSSDL